MACHLAELETLAKIERKRDWKFNTINSFSFSLGSTDLIKDIFTTNETYEL